MDAAARLFAIKLVHTAAWAFFAGCIVAIPLASHHGHLHVAAALIGIVLVEVLVLACNRGRCPLTPLAARYTADRAANFDIFLPQWLARNNKQVFGALFIAGVIYTAICWIGSGAAG